MNDTPANLTALSVPLSRTSGNIAPAKPLHDFLQNRKLNKTPTKFEESIRQWITARMSHERAAWDEMISMAQLVALFRKGNQLLQRRRYGPGYYVRPIQQDDTAIRQTAMNLMSFHAQVCESKIMAANPTVNMRAGDDTPEAIAAAQACRPVVDYYESEWYTAKFSRREAIRFLTDGIVIHQVRWNPFLGGYQVAGREVTKRDIVIDEGGGECLDCSFEGPAEAFEGEMCPECQSPTVEVRQPIKQQMSQIGMGQSRPVGEPEIITSPFASWRWDLSKDLECSSWAIKRQYIGIGAVRLLIGDTNVPTSQSGDQYGLDVLRALTYSGQAYQGQSYTTNYRAENKDNQPVLTECWLSPENQAEIEFDAYETVDGQQVPRGRLSDVCKGQFCCVVALNDGALVAGAYVGESHQDEVVTAQWFMDAESGGGRGMEDTAAVQRRFNAVDGHVYQGLANTATPSVFTDMRLIREDQGRYLFTPGQNVDIDLSLLPPGLGLKDAIFIGSPGAVSQQYIQYGYSHLMQMAQISSLITEVSIGNTGSLLGVDNRTATGAQITSALANSLYGPMLMSKGQSRVEIAKKIVCLVSKHSVGGRYYPGKGAAKGRMVDSEQVKGRVIFDLVPNSQLPVTPFSQQTDVRVLIESFQGVASLVELKGADPGMFRQLTKPFNVPLDIETEDDVSNICLGRLEQMKSNLMAGVNDPQMLVDMIRPTVRQTEPKHKEKATWWSNWLDLQSAQEAPEELRQAAENMFWLHQNLMTQAAIPQAMNQGMVSAAQMAPAAMGQAALQPQEEAAPEKDDTAKIEADVAMDQAKHETDLQLKQMESQTQLAQTQLQGEYQLENTRLAGKNQIAAAKAKPKPVVRKSA